MLCGNCRKNQATKTYEQIKKGKRETAYYCLDCYHKLFVCADEADGNTPSACPYCGTTAAEFKKRKLVGCAYCYETLKNVIFPVVTKMQGGEIHKGKQPFAFESGVDKRLRELKVLADKSREEGEHAAARAYEQQSLRLRDGLEEEYVWRKRPDLSKRS